MAVRQFRRCGLLKGPDAIVALQSDADTLTCQLANGETRTVRICGSSSLGASFLALKLGPGTDKFVQGQFSQHVDDVTPQQSRRAAASTPKGRAYCLTRLVRDQQDLLMDLDRELSDATLGQLKKYLMLFRGTRMDVVTVAGDNAATLGSPGDVVATENGYLIRIEDSAGALPRYEWWLPEGCAELPEGLPELTINDWNAASIAAGVPWLTPTPACISSAS